MKKRNKSICGSCGEEFDGDFSGKVKKTQEHYCSKKCLKESQINRFDDNFYDFQTHKELAVQSGIMNSREWVECHKMGLMPEGIYSKPERKFRRK